MRKKDNMITLDSVKEAYNREYDDVFAYIQNHRWEISTKSAQEKRQILDSKFNMLRGMLMLAKDVYFSSKYGSFTYCFWLEEMEKDLTFLQSYWYQKLNIS